MVLFIWGQLSAVYPLSLSQRLPSFSNLNGLSLCSRVEERGGGGGGEDGDVYSDCSVILKIFVRPTSRLYLRLGRPIAHSWFPLRSRNWISWTDVTVPCGPEVNVSKRSWCWSSWLFISHKRTLTAPDDPLAYCSRCTMIQSIWALKVRCLSAASMWSHQLLSSSDLIWNHADL